MNNINGINIYIRLFPIDVFKNSEFNSENTIIMKPILKIINSYEKFFMFCLLEKINSEAIIPNKIIYNCLIDLLYSSCVLLIDEY